MKVPILRVIKNVAYGAPSQFIGLADGHGSATLSFGVHPVPIAGTIRKLVLRSVDAPEDLTVTLKQNGVATGLSATLPFGATETSANTNISVSAGDWFWWAVETDHTVSFPGFNVGLTCEWEGTHQIFGISVVGGSVVAGAGWYGGTLGNGIFQEWVGIGTSNTYSIVGVDGAMTHLVVQRYGAESGGAWTGYLKLNEVVQDGTGGTVDTSCLLSDAGSATAIATFNLPVSVGDHLDTVVVRSGSTAHQGMAAGAAFLPTVDGDFMVVGGTNDDIPSTGTTWRWNNSMEDGADINMHTAPAGLTDFTLTRLYVERSQDPGIGSAFVHTTLRNEIATNLMATVSDLETFATDFGNVAFTAGQRVTLRITNLNSPFSNSRLHWSYGATTVIPPDVVPQGNIGPIAWLKTARRQP